MKEIVGWLQNRIFKQNKNNLIIIVGETGSGKSFRALRLAFMLTHTMILLWWDSKRTGRGPRIWVVFKIKEFFHILSKGLIHKGDVVIWEEGGVEANSRNWYTQQNKLLNFAFQTMRHRNFTLIMTLPSLADVDAGLRKLFHLFIECQYVDQKNDTVRCKVMRIQHNPRLAKTYYKYFRVRKGGRFVIAENVFIRGPPQEMIDQYEPKKKEYTDGLYAGSKQDLDDREERARTVGQPKDYSKEIKDAQKHYRDFQKGWMGKLIISWRKIKDRYKVSDEAAKTIAENIKIPE